MYLSSSSLPLSADNGDEHSEGGLVENHVDGTMNMLGGGGGAGRKPLKSGMKELAVFREKVTEQHRQMGKGGKHHLGLEEPKKLRPPPARVSGGPVDRGGHGKGVLQLGGHPTMTCGQSTFVPIAATNTFSGLGAIKWTQHGFLKSSPSKTSAFLLGFGSYVKKTESQGGRSLPTLAAVCPFPLSI